MATTAAVLTILVNAQTKGAIAQLTALDTKLKQSETRAQSASAGIGKKIAGAAKMGTLALGAGLGYALFSATKKTMEFDAQLSSLQAVSKANRAEMKKFEKQAITMGAATVFSATEAAQAQIELAKGGLTVKEIMGGGLKSALALAAAGELALSEAATTTVNAMKLFQIDGRNSMKVADMLATAANKTTADVRDFAMALSQGGSVAKQAGYDLNDTVVVLEALAEAGVKNSDAGTSMKAAFVQLLGPTEKQKKLADSLNMSFVDQSGKLKDAAGLSIELRDGLRGMSDAQRAATLKTLAGTDGFRTLAALYDAGSDKLKRLEKANEKQGTAAKVARQKNNNLKGDLEQLSGAYETLQILIGNKVNPTLRRMVGWVSTAVNAISGLVQQNKNGRKAVEDFEKKNKGLVAVLKIVWAVIKGVISIFKLFIGLIFDTGNTLKRLREVSRNVGEGMKAVFEGAWLAIRTKFRNGANAVIGIVNSIIGVLNKIPGVDIGKVGIIVDPNIGKDANGPSLGRQRGGPINIGKPSGDSVPTMLERGEYVLNRNAVKAVGKKQLDAVNFGSAPRFQKGGMIGMIGGGVVDAASGLASDAMGAARDVLGKGAGFFINQLPTPNLPQPFTGTGPWLIDHVKEWIKGKVPKAGALGNLPGTLGLAMEMARQFGLTITSTLRPGDSDSYHGIGRAFDASNGVNTPEMMAYAKAAAGKWGSRMLEMFYDPLGWFIDNGQKFPGAIGGHSDHVHVAMQRGGLVQTLAKGGLVEKPWFDTRTKKGNINGIWPSADLTKDPNAWYALPTLPPYVFGALAEAAGRHFGIDVPGRAMMQMIMHEGGTPEGGKPGSRGTDPGGTVGYGPWAITTTYNDALVKRFGGSYGAMNNPVLNAAAMAHIVRDQGLGAWYGDKYVTDPNADWKGKYQLKNALGGIGYSAALRSALGGDPQPGRGDTGGDSQKNQSRSRREAREKKVRELIQSAFATDSPKGKKGALWQILDLYAKYGDFETRGSQYGGVGPGLNEAASFLSRAGQIASIADPNRGAGQLYGLAKWLQGNVDLTGSDKANDAMSDRLKKVREAGGGRAQKRRQKLHKKLAKYGTDFPWKEALNKNASTDEILDDLASILNREHQSEGSAFGSEYSPEEIAKESGVLHKLFATRDNRYRMLMRAIPWAEQAQKFYERKVNMASSNPGERWLLPGYRKGLSSVKGLLNGGSGNFSLREDLKTLVGASGVAGLSIYGGTRGDAFSRWQELLGTKSGGAGVSSLDMSGLLQIVEFAKYGGYDSLPKFHSGGVVPGYRGQEVPIMAQAGETVVPNGGLGDVKVEVNFADGMGWLKEFVDVRVSENGRRSDQMMKAGVR